MPPRDWRLRLEDIAEAINRILGYTDGFDFAQFSEDARTVDAVVRNLEVIGEAAGHLPDDVIRRFAAVPWAEMRAMRNILAHAYFGVDLGIIWKTVTEDLPELRRSIQAAIEARESRP